MVLKRAGTPPPAPAASALSAIPPIETELAPRIAPTRCANRGLNPPQQTSWTGGSNDAGVVRPSASGGGPIAQGLRSVPAAGTIGLFQAISAGEDGHRQP